MVQNIYCVYSEPTGMIKEARFIKARSPKGVLEELNGDFKGLKGAWLIQHGDGLDIVGADSEERAILTFSRIAYSQKYTIKRLR